VLGCLATMPVAAALSPGGDLVVACHGGAPDWGSGPAGAGSVLRIFHARPDLPQPRFAFTPAPGEVRVVFDRPLRPEWLARTAADSRIDFGSAVSAGDRFEQFRPGYAVVVAQDLDPRRTLPIDGVQVSPDGHTLVLAAAPHRTAVGHALTLALDPAAFAGDGIVDLAYAPDGSAAEWHAADGSERWSGWLPCLDTALARQLTAGSPDHDGLWHLLERAVTLTLATSLDLSGMLRPEVQPNAALDAALPREVVTVSLSSPTALWRDDGHAPSPSLPLTGPAGPRELVVHATTGPGFALTCRWSTAEDPRPRVLPFHRHRLPWVAPPGRGDSPPVAADDLASASWSRGRRLFFGDEAACSRCHRHGGRGGWIGPDLSNLVHRDPRSVRRDIAEPNATLYPEHLAHTLALADGRALTGIVRTDGAGHRVGLLDGTEIRLRADEVEEMQPSAVSVMPTGLAEKLGPERLSDLVLFLTRPAPRMPLDAALAPPPPRSRAEVTALLAGASPAAAPPRRLVLVAGPKDHGPGEHDYPAWQAAWGELLGVAEGVTVDVASPWPSAEQLATADGLVLFQRGEWTPSRAAGLDALLARGGGAVFIHYAGDGGADPAGLARRIGLAWEGGRSRFRHGPLDLDFTADGAHPIARNLDRVALVARATGTWSATRSACASSRPRARRAWLARCFGRPIMAADGCSCRSRSTIPGRSTTRCSVRSCCAVWRGQRATASTATTSSSRSAPGSPTDETPRRVDAADTRAHGGCRGRRSRQATSAPARARSVPDRSPAPARRQVPWAPRPPPTRSACRRHRSRRAPRPRTRELMVSEMRATAPR
jgi:putative heme-binding domain-containing protein